MAYVLRHIAEYTLIRTNPNDGTQKMFFVYFLKGVDGVWRMAYRGNVTRGIER